MVSLELPSRKEYLSKNQSEDKSSSRLQDKGEEYQSPWFLLMQNKEFSKTCSKFLVFEGNSIELIIQHQNQIKQETIRFFSYDILGA